VTDTCINVWSAFSESIYRGLPVDFYIPLFNAASDYVRFLMMIRSFDPGSIEITPYQIHDTTLMFYQDLETVRRSLCEPRTLWQMLVFYFVGTKEFEKINMVTRSSIELTSLATAKFLIDFMRRIERTVNLKMLFLLRKSCRISDLLFTDTQQLCQLLGIDQKIIKNIVTACQKNARYALYNTLKELKKYTEAKDKAMNVAKVLTGGYGYSHDLLSAKAFLKDPDEYRRRVELLKLASRFLNTFIQVLPTSFVRPDIVFTAGAIHSIDRILWETQLKDVVPQELVALVPSLNPDLQKLLQLDFLLRLSQKQVLVYHHSASSKYIVFVDKSGSMANYMIDPPTTEPVPKISIAVALALAIYLKYGADIYLFDTGVEGPVNRFKIVDTLLQIGTEGGTNITEVLEKIMSIGMNDHIYVVITDAIDVVDESVIKKLDTKDLRRNVRFVVIPPCGDLTWLKKFVHIYIHDILRSEIATLKLLR